MGKGALARVPGSAGGASAPRGGEARQDRHRRRSREGGTQGHALSRPLAPTSRDDRASDDGFRHEALFYAGRDEFRERTTAFIRDGLDRDEATLVVVGEEKIDLLRSDLGEDAERVQFADMGQVGRNPARIIPAWRDFVAERAPGRRVRGIGEPISAGRSAEELVECQLHESLLNLAFADGPAWWLLCPYDTAALGLSQLEEARRNHPHLLEAGAHRRSASYRDGDEASRAFDGALPEPDMVAGEMSFEAERLHELRAFVAEWAAAFPLPPARIQDLVLAVDEVATNSVLHGEGGGVLRVWEVPGGLVCEVRDRGRIADPLVGRERPGHLTVSGFGLWLVNRLCDLVQIRRVGAGTVVRLHVAM